MMMSLSKVKDPFTRALLKKQQQQAQQQRVADLQELVSIGYLPKPEAEALLAETRKVQLSVNATTGDMMPAPVDDKIRLLKRMAAHHPGVLKRRLSLEAKEVVSPIDNEGRHKEVIAAYAGVGEPDRNVPVNGKSKK